MDESLTSRDVAKIRITAVFTLCAQFGKHGPVVEENKGCYTEV